MNPKIIDEETRRFGAPGDWKEGSTCDTLSIRDLITEQGNFMVSSWEPTPEEIEKIKAGETVKLWIRGYSHPVVAITVGDVYNENSTD